MLQFKVFSLAVLAVVVSSQSFPTGGMGGAGMGGAGMGGPVVSGGMGGAGMSGGMGGAGMSGGMGGAGMYGGMGMLGGAGLFMNADMMDTLSDMYGSRMAMPGYGMGSGLGNFPNPRQQFPMGQFLPQTAAYGGKGRPPTQTFTGIGAIIKTISGIGGNINPITGPQQAPPSNPTVANPATNEMAYFPRTNY